MNMEECRRNELKPDDLFEFECAMCGSCCWRRTEPIVVTGPNVFRIARARQTTPQDVVEEYLSMNIDPLSHLPTFTIRERLDGSCKFLCNGCCTIQKDKPVVCALFPLGRYYNPTEDEFRYFTNPGVCEGKQPCNQSMTLEEWLAQFSIRETEDMSRAWNRLVTGLAMVTGKAPKEQICGKVIDTLLDVLFLDYDPTQPYIPQLEQHMTQLHTLLGQKVVYG